jgi:diguanylate cyclase (GGDEF)-like protein/PAS domain S-box-containing protein
MRREQILPVLYEMALVIGGETSLNSLLLHTVQRLLYYTSYPAGFVCLELPKEDAPDGMLLARLDAVVGDYELAQSSGQVLQFPAALLRGYGQRQEEARALLERLPASAGRYRAFLRLPIGDSGVIILLAPQMPESELPLTQMFQPVMANLAKAIELCRQNDAHQAAVAAQRGQLESMLQQSEVSFRALMELSPIGVGFSCDGIVVDMSAVCLRMFGYDSIDEVKGQSLLALIAAERREQIVDKIRRRAEGLPVESIYETIGLRKDGSKFPLLVSAQRVELSGGARTFTFFIDLSDQKQTEFELRSANEMLSSVLENVPARVFWKDTESRYLGCNSLFARDAGLQRPDELVGKDDFAMGWRAQAELYRADDARVMAADLPKLAFEEPQTTPDGREVWLRTSKVPLHDNDGKVFGVLGIYDDITEQKQAEAQIRQLAFFDSLTGLPNRRLLQDRVQQAMAGSARSGRHGALVMLDMDQFKTVNDTRGHTIGDELLVEVARRLQACVREGDSVARLGGDEFVVVLEDLSPDAAEAAAQAEAVAEKVRGELGRPYRIEGGDCHTSPSIGIVLFSDHEQPMEALFVHADMAMYQAKAGGRNTIRFYDPEMQSVLAARSELESALRGALARDELQLYYQIQVDGQGRPLGAEALLRWRHPVLGMVSPARFIPVAEESGLILPIGQWVLETACAQLARWQQHPALAALTLAVNVSARQFRQDNFVAQVRACLTDNRISPSRLKLELTESMVLENVEETIRKMGELKSLGVRFSMDDFGTGYSSLIYLKRLPLDQIKIDQSFVRDITTDQDDAAIVQTIIAMAHSLDLEVIAEGVETAEQRAFLEQRGCRAYQGYLFGRPVAGPEFEAALLSGTEE